MSHHRTVVVGAGFSGIAMAIRLLRDGERDFVLLERGSELGGTWRDICQIYCMRKKMVIPVLILSGGLLFQACNKKEALPDPCLGVSYDIQYFKTESVGSSNNGSLTITSPVGDTISYQLNSAAFQSSPIFSNLAPGDYRIIVKNQKGCTDTTQVTIFNYGPKYAQVKQLIAGTGGIGGYCGPCHLNGAINGGKNFDTDASIVASWDRIKARAVDGLPTFMPEAPNSPLTMADRQKITDWVNAGHRQSD